jgi:hypothetical protein
MIFRNGTGGGCYESAGQNKATVAFGHLMQLSLNKWFTAIAPFRGDRQLTKQSHGGSGRPFLEK